MAATTLLTSDQFLALPDELDQNGNPIKVELIGGEIVRMPPASLLHGLIKNKINELLIDFLHANPQLDLRSLVEIGVQVGGSDALIPDVSVVKRASLPGESRIYQGAPEIAIQVVSPTDTAKHIERKIDAYLQAGAKSVWIVFPESRSITIHTAETVRKLKVDQPITDPSLPGFSSPVSAFFDLA
jgi:Uma2 family endonuclease